MFRKLFGNGMRIPPVRSYQRFYSTSKPPTPKKRMGMKELAKEYGWTATGVYLALCCIDLPLGFLLVHSAGTDRLVNWEVSIRDFFGANTEREKTYVQRAASGGKSLFLAEFAIAYVIHKMCIFIRVPLTVAITPSIAAKLGQWGFMVKKGIPSVDKQKLASKAGSSSSEHVRKAARIIFKEGKPKQ